jgi:hypothetical protein
VPIPYPNYPPAVVQTPPAEQELWRVLNASADTILDVQYVINGVAQPVQVVAIDGYPIGSGGATGTPQSESETDMLLPPGARAEFVVTTPNVGDQGQLVTQYCNTGPDGDFDPSRPIANIVAQATPQPNVVRLPSKVQAQKVTRFADWANATPIIQRTLQFSEVLQDPTNPNSPTTFFITLAGQTPTAYYAGEPPNITVHQGTVEDWTLGTTTALTSSSTDVNLNGSITLTATDRVGDLRAWKIVTHPRIKLLSHPASQLMVATSDSAARFTRLCDTTAKIHRTD